MLMTFDAATKKIAEGALLHIAATETLLRKLPKGNWVGGSTEYFMAQNGGKTSSEHLFVTEFPYSEFTIKSYNEHTIQNVALDAYENGFSIVVIPYESAAHKLYAEKAPDFETMFMKNIAGWIAGKNLNKPEQTPIAANGFAGTSNDAEAAVLHVAVPDDKAVMIGVINIFSQDENAALIEFASGGFTVRECLINGKKSNFADYLAENKIDTNLPLVGDYSGNSVNVSFQKIEDGTVYMYAPVFRGIKYRVAKKVPNYVDEFRARISETDGVSPVFSCNCVLNFLLGELEGKETAPFNGPVTFGEIAYQLLGQTLAYVSVRDL